MNALERLIRAEIEANGPMGVDRFMALALGHPEHGYYMRRDALGRDFTTAPEIHQIFGEMIGIWVVLHWAPGARLVELGPGRGTMMADMLRVLGTSGIAPEVWLIETSEKLIAEQAKRVPGAQWATRLEEVPEGPILLIANEFFDALPVKQYLRSPEGWRERLVGMSEQGLVWGLSGVVPLAVDPGRPAHALASAEPASLSGKEPGTTVHPPHHAQDPANVDAVWFEQSAAALRISADIAKRLSRNGGAALIVDYGYSGQDRPSGPTLQAIRTGEMAPPLEAPGEADLTWLVDFDALEGAMSGMSCRLLPQGRFLADLGVGARAEALAKAAPGEAGTIADALERLTGPAQMGSLFKVLEALPERGMTP